MFIRSAWILEKIRATKCLQGEDGIGASPSGKHFKVKVL